MRKTADFEDFKLAAGATRLSEGLAGVLRTLRRAGFTLASETARSMWRDWLVTQPEPETADVGPLVTGTIAAPEDHRQWATGTTFVFTSAQSNTLLNDKFWASLMVLVEDRQAQLHISRFTYNKQQYGKNSIKPGSGEASDNDDIWFDPRIEPFVSDESVQIAADLIWCGELNIIPTRVDTITGFQN